MKKKVKYKYTKKYYGFLRKHTRMWWRGVKKEFIKRGIHPVVDYSSSGYVISWFIKECPLIRFGAWMRDSIDNYELYADWDELIDKFKPNRSPFNFSSVDEMISEAVKMVELYKIGGQPLNDYIRENSAWSYEPDKDMLALIESEGELRKRNGLTKEEWDNAFACRKIVAEEAIRDNSIWGVVIAPRMQFFRNIPETLFVIIEDESDKISDEDWNRAWSEWGKKRMDIDYDNHINLEIISKYDMEKYAHRNRRIKNIIKKGRWLKGSYKDL